MLNEYSYRNYQTEFKTTMYDTFENFEILK